MKRQMIFHKKPSPLFTDFLGAAILIVGLLSIFAFWGEWGIIGGFIALTATAIVNFIRSPRFRKGPNDEKS